MAGAKKALRVIGAAVVLRTEDGGERYLYQDAVVSAAGFKDESVSRAIDNGLVEEVDAPAGSSSDTAADDKPTDKWTNEKIVAYAAEHSIDLGEATTKKELLAAIAAAPAE